MISAAPFYGLIHTSRRGSVFRADCDSSVASFHLLEGIQKELGSVIFNEVSRLEIQTSTNTVLRVRNETISVTYNSWLIPGGPARVSEADHVWSWFGSVHLGSRHHC